MTESDLEVRARIFAADLTATVQAVSPTCEPFRASATVRAGAERWFVRQEPDTGIPLMVDDEPLLTLKVQYLCAWDTPGSYLAVDESHVKVFPGSEASGEPLFRYEYLRSLSGKDLPGAHVHVHAHRDGIAYVMGRAGTSTKRAARRAASRDVPTLSELHIPVGGPRFRPCLEDVLEMLVSELGVECSPEGREALMLGRQEWRRLQLGSAVRDQPEVAGLTLAEMGYTVTAPDGGHPAPNVPRLREH